jgi:hypothetical protein
VYTEVHLWSTPGQSGVYTGVMPIDGMKKEENGPCFPILSLKRSS